MTGTAGERRGDGFAAARRTVRAAGALLLALGWLLVSVAPASSSEVLDPEARPAIVESPAPDEEVDRPTELVIAVQRLGSDQVTAFSRLRHVNGKRVAPRRTKDVIIRYDYENRDKENSDGGTVQFTGDLNPYNLGWFENGGAISNGEYHIEVTALAGKKEGPAEGSDWTPFPVTFDAPPPPPANVRSGAEGLEVTVAWDPVAVPDLLRYRVERRNMSSTRWRTVAKDVKPSQTAIREEVPAAGTYRYRVTAVRKSAEEGKVLTALSAPSRPLTVSRAESTSPPPTPQEQAPDTQQPSGSSGGSDSSSSSSSPSSPQQATAPSGQMNPSLSSADSGPDDGDWMEPFTAPENPNQTYDGPIDFGVDPTREVTERVPVDIARGGEDPTGPTGTLQVLNRTLNDQRVLQPLAGGLVLLLSAAHVIRFLHE